MYIVFIVLANRDEPSLSRLKAVVTAKRGARGCFKHQAGLLHEAQAREIEGSGYALSRQKAVSCSITTSLLHPPALAHNKESTPLNLLQHIAQSRHLLRKSELKVADHVLLDPAAVMHSSMADLAHSVGISEPTIVRFCRAIGCSGFQDLKLKLAQSLAAGASFGQFAIHEDDSVADYSLKIFDTTLHTLMEVREKLDPLELQRAVTLMSQAQRVEFYGFGASGAVAADAQHKFFRLLLTAAAYSDPHMQAMSAVTLKPTDVAICISQSGRSKDLLITANLVRESGASLITLCPSQTPLAELSTVNLAIDVHEDTEIYTPLTSRIAHLVVIDVLAMGVAMARGPSLVNHLKSVKRSLRGLRLSPKSVHALDE